VEEGRKRGQSVIDYPLELNEEVEKCGGKLSKERQEEVLKEYGKLLKRGDTECPKPEPKPPGKRGGAAKPGSRNPHERLMERADEVLRFITKEAVPFTNNQAERDLRMMKVQRKISRCFRSMEGAKVFRRIRGYISTRLMEPIAAVSLEKTVGPRLVSAGCSGWRITLSSSMSSGGMVKDAEADE
jgi:transposase